MYTITDWDVITDSADVAICEIHPQKTSPQTNEQKVHVDTQK